MPRRALSVAAVVALACSAAACSTPETGRDDLATGKARVEELLTTALDELPPEAAYILPEGPGEQTCRKTFLGYAVGATGDHRAEMPVVVDVPPGMPTRQFLDDIEDFWRAEGYEVSRPETADGRYPKVRAEVDGGYRITMTAFTRLPRLTLYAVSPCLADS